MTAEPTIRDIADRLDRLEALALIGSKNVLDIDEAALYTGFSKGHLYRLTCERRIPHCKRSRKLYFDKAALDAWLTEVSVPTKAQTAAAATTYVAIHSNNK